MTQNNLLVGRPHDCLLVLAMIAQRADATVLLARCAAPYLIGAGWQRDDVSVALERLSSAQMIESVSHTHRGGLALAQCAHQRIMEVGQRYITSRGMRIGALNWNGLPDEVVPVKPVPAPQELPIPASKIIDLLSVVARPVSIGVHQEHRVVNVERILVDERICTGSTEADHVVKALEQSHLLVRVSEREVRGEVVVTHALRIEQQPKRRLSAVV